MWINWTFFIFDEKILGRWFVHGVEEPFERFIIRKALALSSRAWRARGVKRGRGVQKFDFSLNNSHPLNSFLIFVPDFSKKRHKNTSYITFVCNQILFNLVYGFWRWYHVFLFSITSRGFVNEICIHDNWSRIPINIFFEKWNLKSLVICYFLEYCSIPNPVVFCKT